MSALNNATINNTNGGNTMNRSEIVRAYVAANPNPIQDLCPRCYQYWSNSKGYTITWDNVSGKRKEGGCPRRTWGEDYFVATPVKAYDGAYYNYIPELGMFEVASIVLNVDGRGVDGYPVQWAFYYPREHRMFTFVGSTVAYDINGNELPGSKYYNRQFKSLMHILTYSNYHEAHKKNAATLAKMGAKLDDDITVSAWRIEDWYTRNWMPRTTSTKSKAVTSYDLDNVNISVVPADIHVVLVHEILDDNYTVLREFAQKYRYTSNGYAYNSEWEENARVFIDNKGKPSVMLKEYSGGNWKITTRQIKNYYGDAKELMLIGDPIENWTPLKYIKNCVDWKDIQCLCKLVTILRHPIVEMLAKSGYPNLAKEICIDNEVAANLKHFFLIDRERKLPIYELLEVNKFVLKEAEAISARLHGQRNTYYRYRSYDGMNFIRNMKILYSKSAEDSDIRYLSKETVDLATSGFADMNRGTLKELLGKTGWEWRHTDRFDVSDEDRKFVEKLFRISAKSGVNAMELYIDIVRTYDHLWYNRRPEINLKDFSDIHGMEIIHNGLVAIKVEQDRERQARYDAQRKAQLEEEMKKFERLQEGRIKLYECDGDKFCIRVPKKPEELTTEGCMLHHCVGGYVSKHSKGETNIIFLRKKGAEDIPFYTIEVNNGKVIQIHGDHNRWLGNDPEAIPFVYKWVTERGFICDKKLLLNCGAGYSPSDVNLDESYLTM